MALYDANIERALLSSFIFSPYDDGTLSSLHILRSSDFYIPFHASLFMAIKTLVDANRPIDEDFLRITLQKEGKFDEVAMLEVLSANPISHLSSYVSSVREYAQKRMLVTLSMQTRQEIEKEGDSPSDVLERAIKRLEAIAEGSRATIERVSMHEAKESAPTFVCKNWLPIPKATLSMIVAPGGTGKTWLALQLALRIANEDAGNKVFLWLSEDPEGTVKSRYNTIKKEVFRATDGREDLQIDISTADPMLLLETRGKSVTMSSKFYAMKRELREYDVIVIDPLLAFYGGDENDNSQARVFMQPFLNWARTENKSIIFLHHSKKGEGNNSSRARGAGAIVDAVRCVYDMDKIYVNKSGKQELDPLSTHLRSLSLTKDNYGAIEHLKSFRVEREITPSKSAPTFEVEYEMVESISMPRIA